MAYCGHCGTELDDSAVFCPRCGQKVLPSPPIHTDVDSLQPMESNDDRTSDKAAAPRKSMNRKAIVIAVALVALLAVVGAIIVHSLHKADAQDGASAQNGVVLGEGAGKLNNKKTQLEGAYEDNFGLIGIYQFNKDGTVYYYYESWTSDDYDILIGEYRIGDDGTVYITGIESDLASMCSVLKYDKSADLFTCSVEGENVIFTRVDIDLPQPDDNASQTEDEKPDAQSDAAKTDNIATSQIEPIKNDEFTGPAKVIDDYMGNPVQAGFASDNSYLTKIAESDDYIYWHWMAGGGYGVMKQSAAAPYTVIDDYGSPMADKFLMLALYREEYGDLFRFESITYAGDGEIYYNGEVIPADQWLFVSEDGSIRNYAAINATVESRAGFGQINTTAYFLNGEPWVYYDDDSFVYFY